MVSVGRHTCVVEVYLGVDSQGTQSTFGIHSASYTHLKGQERLPSSVEPAAWQTRWKCETKELFKIESHSDQGHAPQTPKSQDRDVTVSRSAAMSATALPVRAK